MALLEMLVALAILGGAGAALVATLAAGMRARHEIGEREMEMKKADQILTATSLLSRPDLDRRLGRHPAGEMVVEVQRPNLVLYRLSVSASHHPNLDLLATVVYRPEPPR
jgi:hypothetical protein